MTDFMMINKNLFTASLNCLSAYHAELNTLRKQALNSKATGVVISVEHQMHVIEQIVKGLMQSAESINPPSTN